MSSEDDLFKEEAFCYSLDENLLPNFCHGCLRDSLHLKRCKGCQMFYYCSTECQKKDWPLHKIECASCKKHTGVASMYFRFVMRLATKWAAGDMGETTVDNVMRSLSTLPCSTDAPGTEEAAHFFLKDYKAFCKKSFVSDDVIKRLFMVACLNSFVLLTDYGLSIGISLHIRLSGVGHSCKPNVACKFRGSTAIMVPTDLSRVPLSLKEARRSYVNTLLPRKMRREFLKMQYNIDCECEGCLDEERNERMEGWRCLECEDGWLPPHANAKCSRCGWVISQNHLDLCRMAENTAKSRNPILLNEAVKFGTRFEVARQIFPILDSALYKFNVLRLASLSVFHRNAFMEMNVEHMLKYVNDELSIHEQYLNKDDMELQYLRSFLAEIHITVADQNKYRFFNGMAEVDLYFCKAVYVPKTDAAALSLEHASSRSVIAANKTHM